MIGAVENYSALVKPAAISKHLKVVKVHCKEVDEVVYKIGKWLSTLDIKVIIKQRKQSPKRKLTIDIFHSSSISEICIFFIFLANDRKK